MSTSPTDQQLIDFVVREARLLDQQRLEDWLDLFTEDGHYWTPNGNHRRLQFHAMAACGRLR